MSFLPRREAACQSSLATATLQQLGFAGATDVDGGFQAWRGAGLPIDQSGTAAWYLRDQPVRTATDADVDGLSRRWPASLRPRSSVPWDEGYAATWASARRDGDGPGT